MRISKPTPADTGMVGDVESHSKGTGTNLLVTVRRGQTFQALGNYNYRLLWLGQLGASTCLWMDMVARNVLIWDLTGSGMMLGLLNLVRAIPFLLFSMVAGSVADRFDKRKVLIGCQVGNMLAVVVLAALISSGLIQVWHVFVEGFFFGVFMSFNQPTRQSFVPELVGRDELMNAVALNSAAMNVTRVVGPAAAGALIAVIRLDGIYYLQALIYALVILATYLMQTRPISRQGGGPSLQQHLGEAMTYIKGHQIIFTLLALALVPMIFGMPYMTLVVIFAKDIFRIGDVGYGLLMSFSGVGGLIGALIVASSGGFRRRGLLVLGSVFSFGLLLAAFALLSPALPLFFAFLLITLVGFVQIGSMSVVNTLLLSLTPPELHGRIMGIYMLDRGLMPLGSVLAGTMTDLFGAPVALSFMGSVCLLLALAVGLAVPRLRQLE